jgi:Rod binding domain-containing protein
MNVAAIASSSVAQPPLHGAALRAAPPEVQRRQVAAQFEAILVRQLLGKSVASMLGGASDTAGSVYGDMLTDSLAQNLTAGQGLGLGRMIERQLTPRGLPAAGAPLPSPSTH